MSKAGALTMIRGIVSRRAALLGLLPAVFFRRASAAAVTKGKTVKIAEFDSSGKLIKVLEVDRIEKTAAEWQQQLTPLQFQVTRKQGTERAFSGKYATSHDDGLYRCICCGTVLFDSKTKFESGTGWPSFWQPIAKENVREETDTSLSETRTEVLCARCDSHIGHVFEDGPRPTGLRYCMNGVALKFVKGKA